MITDSKLLIIFMLFTSCGKQTFESSRGKNTEDKSLSAVAVDAKKGNGKKDLESKEIIKSSETICAEGNSCTDIKEIQDSSCKSESYCLSENISKDKVLVDRSSCDIDKITKGGFAKIDLKLCNERPMEYCVFDPQLNRPLKLTLSIFELSQYQKLLPHQCQDLQKRLVCLKKDNVFYEVMLNDEEIQLWHKRFLSDPSAQKLMRFGECLPSKCEEEKYCVADTIGKTQELSLNSCTINNDLKEKNLRIVNKGACTSSCLQKQYCLRSSIGNTFTQSIDMCTKDSYLANNKLTIVNEGSCTKTVCKNVAATNFVGDELATKLRANELSNEKIKNLYGKYPDITTVNLNLAWNTDKYPGAYGASETYAGGRGYGPDEFIDRRKGGVTNTNVRTAIQSHHATAKSVLSQTEYKEVVKTLFGVDQSEITVLESNDKDIIYEKYWDINGIDETLSWALFGRDDTRGQASIWHSVRYKYKGVEFRLHLLYAGAWFTPNDTNWDNEMIAWYWEKPKVKEVCEIINY